MQYYNARAEKKIIDLLQGAKDVEDLEKANVKLGVAYEILEEEFESYSLDSIEDSENRLNSKMKLYKKIIDTYDEIINDFLSVEDNTIHKLSELERKLRDIN